MWALLSLKVQIVLQIINYILWRIFYFILQSFGCIVWYADASNWEPCMCYSPSYVILKKGIWNKIKDRKIAEEALSAESAALFLCGKKNSLVYSTSSFQNGLYLSIWGIAPNDSHTDMMSTVLLTTPASSGTSRNTVNFQLICKGALCLFSSAALIRPSNTHSFYKSVVFTLKLQLNLIEN